MVEILFVDDEPSILKALRRTFHRYKNWKCHFALSPSEALQILSEHDIAVLVSDHKMPQMEGAEFLTRIREKRPNTVRMMLTGQADLAAVKQAVNSGQIFRFILKPWDDVELRQAVTNAVEHHCLTAETQRLQELTLRQVNELTELNKSLEDRVQLRTSQLSDSLFTAQELNRRLEETLYTGTKALTSMIQLARPEVGTHSRRVAEYARAFGSKLGLQPEELKELEVAALLHDNGKLGLPPFLLEKSVKDYSSDELEIYRTHPITGAQHLEVIPGYQNICMSIRAHHERYQGQGFPDGLRGRDVPLEAYVIGLADEFDHLMTIPNPNREYVCNHALQRIADMTNEQFPSALVQNVLDCVQSIIDSNADDESLELGLADIAPNMTLAKDIYSMGGTLLLAGGSCLTPQNIRLIRSIARVDPVAGKIRVSRKPRLSSKCRTL